MTAAGTDPLVTQLAERVSRLEQALAQAGDSEALQPNYLTVNPDGTVSADFTGHVHAEGIDIDAGVGDAVRDNQSVRWLDSTTGDVRASLYAEGTPLSELEIEAVSSDDAIRAEVLVSAHAADNAFDAALFLTGRRDATPSSIVAGAFDLFGNQQLTLLDSTGASQFLQLGGVFKSVGGVSTLNWAAGAAQSGPVNVAGGFFTGAGVIGALATCNTFAGTNRIVDIDAINGTSFVQLLGKMSPAPTAALALNVAWVAWGT